MCVLIQEEQRHMVALRSNKELFIEDLAPAQSTSVPIIVERFIVKGPFPHGLSSARKFCHGTVC